jgi:hypothetical protein
MTSMQVGTIAGLAIAYLTVDFVVCMIASRRADLAIHRDVEDTHGETVWKSCVHAHAVMLGFMPRPGWLVATNAALHFRSYPYLWPFLLGLRIVLPYSDIAKVSACPQIEEFVVQQRNGRKLRFRVQPWSFTLPASITTSGSDMRTTTGGAQEWAQEIANKILQI